MSNTLKLKNGALVPKSEYVKLKTKALVEFGYDDLTESHVELQLDKLLSNNPNIDIIGMFIQDEIASNQ